MIPYGRQDISEGDILAVEAILRSDFLTQGPAIAHFEQVLAEACGSRYAVAVCNATAALHIACEVAGLGPGDLLWTSPVTFVASANCGRYCSADVDFVDIDPETYNLDPEALEQKLVAANAGGRLPKVLVPVHLAGQSCDMSAIGAIARRYGIKIIEDASHAIGGSYKGRPIGNCAFSDMAVFSFHPVKIVTTGEGGAVVTNDHDLYEKLNLLRSHGITRDPARMEGPSHGPWYYQQVTLGYNYRMTDIQAALGSSQMTRLGEFVKRRVMLAERYNALLKDLPLSTPYVIPDADSAFHLYIIRLKLNAIKKSHGEVFQVLRDAGIGVNLHYIPVHTQPYYLNLGFKFGDFPEAEAYYREAISLPLFYGLTEKDQDLIVAALRSILL